MVLFAINKPGSPLADSFTDRPPITPGVRQAPLTQPRHLALPLHQQWLGQRPRCFPAPLSNLCVLSVRECKRAAGRAPAGKRAAGVGSGQMALCVWPQQKRCHWPFRHKVLRVRCSAVRQEQNSASCWPGLLGALAVSAPGLLLAESPHRPFCPSDAWKERSSLRHCLFSFANSDLPVALPCLVYEGNVYTRGLACFLLGSSLASSPRRSHGASGRPPVKCMDVSGYLWTPDPPPQRARYLN